MITSRTRRIRRAAGVTMAAFALIAAVISYSDGLLLIRIAGVTGRMAYLYPLLPDGLIVISSLSLYEAAVTGAPRPRWAMSGIVLGAGLTVAMNVAAGWSVSWLLAVADGFVPVVFFVALEILIGLIRRGRVAVPAAVPVKRKPPTYQQIRDDLGVSQATAKKFRHALRIYAAPMDGGRDAIPQPPGVPATLNGGSTHE
jgi:Protein of unknown function (DUF2637)